MYEKYDIADNKKGWSTLTEILLQLKTKIEIRIFLAYLVVALMFIGRH